MADLSKVVDVRVNVLGPLLRRCSIKTSTWLRVRFLEGRLLVPTVSSTHSKVSCPLVALSLSSRGKLSRRSFQVLAVQQLRIVIASVRAILCRQLKRVVNVRLLNLSLSTGVPAMARCSL